MHVNILKLWTTLCDAQILFSFLLSLEREGEREEQNTDTYGNDQTVLELTSFSLLSESTLEEYSLVGASKHGVTSSCSHQIYQLIHYMISGMHFD